MHSTRAGGVVDGSRPADCAYHKSQLTGFRDNHRGYQERLTWSTALHAFVVHFTDILKSALMLYNEMRILDLFSGTGSLPKQLNAEDECVSVDISGDFHTPTILTDIMEWNYKSTFPVGYFNVVFAGVPSTEYNRLRETVVSIPNHPT